MRRLVRSSLPLRFSRLPRYLALLSLTTLLGGCLITPNAILALPLPSVHTEESLELYYLDGSMPVGAAMQSGHAYRCTFIGDKNWIDGKFREGGHAQTCDDRREYPYAFTYQDGRWVFGSQPQPSPPDALPDGILADAVPSHYVLCTKSGGRLESLNTTLNSSWSRVELKDRGCKEYFPPLQQGIDLYFTDASPVGSSGTQTVTAQLCGSRQEKKAFDFGFRQGGHEFACSDRAKASGYYEFTYKGGHWLLQGARTLLPQPAPATSPAPREAASRRYFICKRIGNEPENRVATAAGSNISPATGETPCDTYLPPEPLKR